MSGTAYTIEIYEDNVEVARKFIEEANGIDDLRGVSTLIDLIYGDAKQVIKQFKV